jgi:hypothetical protein
MLSSSHLSPRILRQSRIAIAAAASSYRTSTVPFSTSSIIMAPPQEAVDFVDFVNASPTRSSLFFSSSHLYPSNIFLQHTTPSDPPPNASNPLASLSSASETLGLPPSSPAVNTTLLATPPPFSPSPSAESGARVTPSPLLAPTPTRPVCVSSPFPRRPTSVSSKSVSRHMVAVSGTRGLIEILALLAVSWSRTATTLFKS